MSEDIYKDLDFFVFCMYGKEIKSLLWLPAIDCSIIECSWIMFISMIILSSIGGVHMELETLAQQRYAVKLFDKNKKLTDTDLDYVLRMAILAPTSFGLQPFRIKVVTDEAIKAQLMAAGWNQPQIGSASHVLIFCADNAIMDRIAGYDKLLEASGVPAEKRAGAITMMKNSFADKTPEEVMAWAAKQAYLAAENAMLAAVSKGFNSCPMEGFSPVEFAKILKLPSNLLPVLLMPLGYPADEQRPKVRFAKDDIVI